jgi:uroporphyrin-III C-methyltransferase
VAIPSTDTLVQYMGGREAIATAQRLLEQGRPAETPVLVLENVSRHDQRIERITLDQLAHGLHMSHGPVLVMLGDAMAARPHQPGDADHGSDLPSLTRKSA